MANLRIVYNNVADTATIAATTQAGGLGPSNLQTDVKSEVYRATSTSAMFTLTWTGVKNVACVAFPFSSLSSAATMRVRLYTNVGDSVPFFDTGNKAACAGFTGTVTGVNGYAFAGGAYASTWFASQACKQVIINLDDATNPLGYIEAGRLVVGDYFSPTNNAAYSPMLTIMDNSKTERTDSGDLRSERGSMHKTLTFNMEYMSATERNSIWNIMRGNGMYSPVYVSLLPESTDPQEEQMYQVYGKLSKAAGLSYLFVNQFVSSMDIEEV
jgi:hypothetical protein